MRFGNRNFDSLRPVNLMIDVNKYAEGSCLISCGDTKVICNASLEKKVPVFLKGRGVGWITAEYGMLPRSTSTTASITGAFVALVLAFKTMMNKGMIRKIPIKEYLAAVSAGIYNDELLLDLDYKEDSGCMADVNFVMTETGKIVEVQGTAEGRTFSDSEFLKLMELSRNGIMQLIQLQKNVLQGIF